MDVTRVIGGVQVGQIGGQIGRVGETPAPAAPGEAGGPSFGAVLKDSLAQVNARPLPVKLRDGIARLFAPYL